MFVTKSCLALLTFAFASIIPKVAAQTCLNSETYSYLDGSKERTCKNIGFNESRRAELCAIAEVSQNCPFSCGVCCEDNADFRWEKNNPLRNPAKCLWVSKKQKRIDRYCDKTKTVVAGGYLTDTITVRYGCPVTCDYCKQLIPVATPAPTKAPAAAPVTPGPTPTQPFPAPSRPPSPMPSPFPTLRVSFHYRYKM